MKVGTDVITTTKAHSNLDSFYGPYTTLDEVYNKLSLDYRKLGLTVGVYQFKEDPNGDYVLSTVNIPRTDISYNIYDKPITIPEGETKYSLNSIKEYLWKKGLRNEDLKEKVEEYILEIDNISYTTDTINDTITFSIKVTGRGFGVLTNIYLGSNKIISEPTVLNENQNIVIKAPENPGNYTYTISAVDSILGNGASTTHEVIWKEVDIKINNSSPIYSYTVKSLLNLLNSSFSFLIFKIDSINIDKISIIYGSNSTILFDGNGEYNEIYDISILQLTGLEAGNLIQIKIEGDMTETFIKDVVQLTSPGIYSSCEGIIPTRVYNGLSFSASFKFEAENIGNYQVIIKDNDLDIVYNSSLISYNTNTITLTLSDPTLSDIKQSSLHTLYVYIGDSESYNYKFNTLTLLYVPNTELLSKIDSESEFLNTLDFNLSNNLNKTLLSYILDLACYIPYKEDEEDENNSSILFLFGNIIITKDIIQFRSIIYPTPTLQNVSLGFMCNVESSYLNNNYYYDALFINGVLCYKLPSEGSPNYLVTSETIFKDKISNKIRLYYSTLNPISQSPENFVLERNFKSRNPGSESSNLPIFNITPINNILTKADLTLSQISQIIDNKITIDGTEYDVIDTTSYRIGNFGNLGDLKYNIQDMINSLCTAYGISNVGLELEVITNLGKKIKKDPSKIPNIYLTLTRQIVKSKKLLQKYVAVPCLWSYGNYSGYLLAFTLGTSTLEYALPNFTFKFFTDKTFSVKSNVSLIPKIERNLTNLLTYSNEINNDTQYYQENELVAKADYMESSHLNNTPTAIFYNAIVSQQNGYTITDVNGNPKQILQNPVTDKLNAIEGIPIVLVINDINYGSFMLNIGKAGKSIGFGSNGISLEGTSNADNSEMSSRFDFSTNDVEAKAYFDSISNDIDNVNTINDKFVEFLKGGLEYRYSHSDIDEIGDNQGTDENPDYSEYLRILKMWHWIYTNETYTKELFEEMFNFDFFALYYIQMMTFGQTDNLGKNCMFDLFEENGLWYVRPYDMDSLAGLENNGNDILSPVIEISKEFVLDLYTKNILTVTYLGNESSRFPYSSKTSNLWIRFYRNLKSDIEIFYRNLRDLGYSSEAVISLCEKEVISKLGINLYNKDFLNKYLSITNSKQLFAFGNRWFRFKDWITKRFDFCDTYFKYNSYAVNTSGDGVDYRIKYSIPLYTLYDYNNLGATVTVTDWGTETKSNFLKFNSITKLNMYFSPKYIIDDDGIFLTGFTTLSPRVKLNNLVNYSGTWNNLISVVDLSENTYLLEMTISNINVISNKASIPKSVMNLYISNSQLIPDLIDFSNLKEITFVNCEGNIHLNNCPNLESITITGCKNINLTLQGCGNNNKYINLSNSSTNFNQIIFDGSYINYLDLLSLTFNLSFTGEKSYFNIVNLSESTILNLELNISNLITNTLLLNSISTVKIITQEAKSYKYLGLFQSNITLFGNTLNTFDGNYISNLNNIEDSNHNIITPSVKMVESINSTIITGLNDNTYTSTIPFRLKRCFKILYVKNLNILANVSLLFYECKELKSVTNSNISASGNYMFYRCYNLETLPTVTNNGTTSTITLVNDNASYMFTSCHKLGYNDIELVLNNNLVNRYFNSTTKKYQNNSIDGVSPVESCKITNYNYFLYSKTYSSDSNIDLSKYAFAETMDYCFCTRNWGGEENTNRNSSNNVILTYSGKLSKSITSARSIFASLYNNHKCILDFDIFTESSNLTNIIDAFFGLNFNEENYFFDVPILPNNPNLNLDRIFCLSKINLDNLKDLNGNIYMPSNTISCSSGFGQAILSEPLEVSDLFSKCTNLLNLTSCFNSCTNFTCTSTFNISSSNSAVNVAGLFANNPTKTITFGFNGIWYSDPDIGYTYNYSTISDSNRYGPYYNTKIKINSESISINGIIGNNYYNMKNVFLNAIIDNSESSLNIDLTINTKNCSKICLNLTILDTSVDSPHEVSINLNIKNSIIETANNAFLNLNILNTTNAIELPNVLVNGSYMFAGTNIDKLPLGLNNCSNLSDISYMFYNCSKINSKIPTNTDYFLPISVTNIDHLFDGCTLLYGGIPNNFIQIITINLTIIDEHELEQTITEITKNNLTSLVCTFASTAILLSDTTFENNANYGNLDISELFPNVTNVEGLFYYMCSSRNLQYSQPLSSLSFQKCTKCNDLFNSARISIPTAFDLRAATELRFAFACGYSGILNLTLIILGNKISDMSGIFSANNSSNINKYIKNTDNNIDITSTLLSMKKGTYVGMLYGYDNDMSKSEYKLATPYRAIRISLHG